LEQVSDIPDKIMFRSYRHVTHSVHN